jgi:hypothetical protein
VDVAPEHSQQSFNTFDLAHEAPEPLAQEDGVTDRSYNRMGWFNTIPLAAQIESYRSSCDVSFVWSGSQDSANSSVSGV